MLTSLLLLRFTLQDSERVLGKMHPWEMNFDGKLPFFDKSFLPVLLLS